MTARSAGFIEGRGTSIDSTFRPPRGLGNPHVQTMAARVRRAGLTPRYRRVRIETDDGDFLDLDIRTSEGGDPADARAACLLLHGLEGCSSSGYMVAAAEALAARGILAIALNFRSCGGEPNRTLGSYHSGRTDDIVRAIDWIRRTYPDLPRAAAGFSLGGNALLVHLGRTGRDAGLAAAAAACVPYRLERSAAALETGLGRLYGRYFLRSLTRKLAEKARRFPGEVRARALEARTLFEFDDAFTAPVHGFAGAADYYRRCSAARFVADVRVPTLLVQSTDDPLVPASSIPMEDVAANAALELALTDRGGHVGYLDRLLGRPDWLETRIATAIAERLPDRSERLPDRSERAPVVPRPQEP